MNALDNGSKVQSTLQGCSVTQILRQEAEEPARLVLSQNHQHQQKLIGPYCISYSNSDLISKSLHGEVRAGFDSTSRQVLSFRVVPLPLTHYMRLFLQRQTQLSCLAQCQQIYPDLHSSANNYQPMEYFNCRYSDMLVQMRSDPVCLMDYFHRFLQTYAHVFALDIPHGNLSLQNIGITSTGEVKLSNFEPVQHKLEQKHTTNSLQIFDKDLDDLKRMLRRMLGHDYLIENKGFPEEYSCLNQEDTCQWPQIFAYYNVPVPFQELHLVSEDLSEELTNNLLLLFAELTASFPADIPPQKTHLTLSLCISLKLIAYKYLKQDSLKQHQQELARLWLQIGSEITHWAYYRSIITSAMQDIHYFGLTLTQQLAIIGVSIPRINHGYLLRQVLQHFMNTNHAVNGLLGNCLLTRYGREIVHNLHSLQ